MIRTKSKFVELWLILRCLTFTRLYHFFLSVLGKLLSFALRKNIVFNQPWALTIEPSAVCQLSCPECLVGKGLIRRSSPFMDMDIFNNILSQLPDSVFYINLYWQGEPLLDKTIFEKISLLKQKKLFVALSTNAQNIDADMAEKLVKSGLDKIIVSMDGFDEETYQRYRKGGSFQRVIKAIQDIHQKKKESKSMTPLIEIQFLLLDYLPKKEIRKFVQNLPIDLLYFKTVQSYTQSIVRKKKKIVCPKLHEYLVIATTGEIAPCCQDKMLNHPVGKIHEMSILQAWNSQAMKSFRKKVNLTEIQLCLYCHFHK